MARRLYERRGARLRVGVPPGLVESASTTGHGRMWSSVLRELAGRPGVRLVGGGRADVWLSSGHEMPPDGRPLVAQVHEASWADPGLRHHLHPRFASDLERALDRTMAVAAHVITPSVASRDQVLAAFPDAAGRVHAVPHGVEVPAVHELTPPPVSDPYILFVGVMHPRKNLDALRAAVGLLAARGLPYPLVAVLSPAADRPDPLEFESESVAELQGAPGRLRVLRGLSEHELGATMAGAAALCLPSHFEGFGLPVLEAMARGTPVVVSARGALPEVVGDAGIVVEPEPRPLADALEQLLSDPARAAALGEAARQRAATFTWSRTAEGWLEILRAAA